MRNTLYLLTGVILTLNFMVYDARAAGNLSNVISDLYGGDGILLSEASAFRHPPHFTANSITALDNLNTVVTGALGFSSFNSTSSGVTFDLSQGIPVATEDSMGPLLSERGTSLGKGKLNVGFSFSRVDFDSFEGTDLSKLTLDFLHDDCCTGDPITGPGPDGILGGFEKDVVRVHINLTLNEDVYAFYGNYGVTNNLDVGMIVPVISVEARANAQAEVIENYMPGSNIHTFAGAPDQAISSTGGSKTGVGDIILRAKYTFAPMADMPSMAVLGQITTPTGDEKNLLGSGEAKFKGMFIASRRFKGITPHVNLAYEVTTGDNVQDNLTYAIGADARMSPIFTVAADILGRYNPHQHEIGNHLVDLAFAVKWNPFKQFNAPFNAYVVIPLNSDEGLRSDVIWGLGVDYSFR